jgi:hypothetical protein
MHEFDKLKKEKALKKRDGGSCEGMKSPARMDRAKRASGGRTPLSTASSTSERPNFKGMKDIND